MEHSQVNLTCRVAHGDRDIMDSKAPDNEPLDAHLSQISTAWTLMGQAHGGSAQARLAAQAALFQRYRRAVYRYLLAALNDAHAADDLFQEFSLKFVRGDFRSADPERGRFRSFLKTSLRNMIINRRRQRSPLSAAELLEEAADPRTEAVEADFLEHWRKELLDRAWEALADAHKPGGPPYYAVLRLRSEQPELSAAELAERVSRQFQVTPALTEAGVRKVLQRAREMFTDRLVNEVARSLVSGSRDELEEELRELGLYAYCSRSLEGQEGG
jgi:RNA polymerase sigma factor (sigma-70 family)